MDPQTTPTKIDLKKDQRLEITWADGQVCTYTIGYLRSMCPCALCRTVREGQSPHDIAPGQKTKPLLTVLPGNYSGVLTATHAELVGSYALRIEFSDRHDTGIYSFRYLRDICPKPSA
jgi:DUF971 family protein